jgi:hypothetical protein
MVLRGVQSDVVGGDGVFNYLNMSLDGEFFLVVVRIVALSYLLAFLRGVLRNRRFSRRFFDCENVVICMVNVVKKT